MAPVRGGLVRRQLREGAPRHVLTEEEMLWMEDYWKSQYYKGEKRDQALDDEYKRLYAENFQPPNINYRQVLIYGQSSGVVLLGDVSDGYVDATKMGFKCSITTWVADGRDPDLFDTSFLMVADVRVEDWEALATDLTERDSQERKTHYIDMAMIQADCIEIAYRQWKHPDVIDLGKYVKAR